MVDTTTNKHTALCIDKQRESIYDLGTVKNMTQRNLLRIKDDSFFFLRSRNGFN